MDLPSRLIGLHERLLAAVSDDGAWPAFLARLVQACEGSVALLFVHDYGAHGRVPFLVGSGFDEASLQAYQTRYGAMNPWVAEQAGAAEGSIVLSQALRSDATMPASAYYDEFMRPRDLRHAIGSNILKTGGQTVKLGVLRSARAGPMGEPALALYTALMPALQAALRLRQRLVDLQLRERMHQDVLDAVAFGVLVLCRDGRIVTANRAAQALLARRDGLVCESGRVSALAPPDRERLRGRIDAATTLARGSGAPLTIARTTGGRPYVVQALPVADTPLALAPAAHIVLFVTDPDTDDPVLAPRIAAACHLTPGESRLTACLVQGLSLAEAADRLGLTEGSARSVSKRVFDKTGTRRQADLVRLVLRGLPPVR